MDGIRKGPVFRTCPRCRSLVSARQVYCHVCGCSGRITVPGRRGAKLAAVSLFLALAAILMAAIAFLNR